MKNNRMKGLRNMMLETDATRRVLNQLKMSGTFMTVSRKVYNCDIFLSVKTFSEQLREALVEKIESRLMENHVDFEANWFSIGNTLNMVIRTNRVHTVVSLVDNLFDDYGLATSSDDVAAAINLGNGWNVLQDLDACDFIEVDADGSDLFLCYGEGLGAKTMRIRASLPVKKAV